MQTVRAAPVARSRRRPRSKSVALTLVPKRDKRAYLVEWAATEIAGRDAVEMHVALERDPEIGEMTRRRYAEAGMPFGDSDAGRCCWVQQYGLRGAMEEPGWVWNERDVRRVHALNELEQLVRARPR